MLVKRRITFFRSKLLAWSSANLRVYPWRKESQSNYQIIITEILLQRTRAETVAKYYNTFFRRYPDWQSITDASFEDLKKILQPLGLYEHRAKRIIKFVEEFNAKNGQLPKNRKELLDSGLSPLYISNAYELLVLNQRSALLDVNMSRLLSRFFNIQHVKDLRHDKIMQELAKTVIDVNRCKVLNWSILDFAAIICKSTNPKCDVCILKTKCQYYMLKNNQEFIGDNEI